VLWRVGKNYRVSGSKKVVIAVAFILAMALVAGVWLGVPGYRRFKERRAVEQAKAFVDKGDPRSAVLSLRTALAMNSSNITAARMMGDLADQNQSPEALAWRKRVFELEPTIDNKLKFAACALRYEKAPFPIAAQALHDISATAQSNATYHAVATDLAIKLNRLAEADQHLGNASALEPSNLLYRLNRATLRLQSGDTNSAAAARAALRKLATDPTLGAPALRSLTADAVMRHENGEAESYSKQLLASPQGNFEDLVLNLTVLSEAKSDRLRDVLRQVQEAARTNAVRVAQITSWMNSHGLAQPALDWLNALPASIHNTLPVPLVEADCFLTVQDWAGLEKRLSGMNWEGQEFMRQALLANSLRNQGRKQIAEVVWKQAVTAASTRGDFVAMLYELANSWGWQEQAEDLLWSLSKRNPNDNWPLQTLLRRYESSENTPGLLRVYEVLLERHPTSRPAKNNVAAISLLLDRDVDRAAGFAKEVYEAEKTNAIFMSTYAFALHTKGKSADALKLMQTLTETDLKRPEIATYYAVLLSAAGDRERAQAYVAAAEKAKILPEERRLLDEIRSKN
jgi:predicted Zn-dependent protease